MFTCTEEIKDEDETDTFTFPYTGFVRFGDPQPHAPFSLFKENQSHLCEEIAKIYPSSVVLLQGGTMVHHYDTATSYEFKQESFFFWLFGIDEPNFLGLLDIRTCSVVMFVPKISDYAESDSSNAVDKLNVKSLYDIDELKTYDCIDDVLNELEPHIILILGGINNVTGKPIIGAKFPNKYSIPIDVEILYPLMTVLRTLKTREEIKIIKRASLITCEAVKYLMLRVKSGNYEYQADAIFRHFCYFSAGCKVSCCRGICASGPNVHNLNYTGPMSRMIKNGDLCMFELGTQYCGYCSNVTVTYPANGVFNFNQKRVYTIVYKMWYKVLQYIKDGVKCSYLQLYAQQILLKKLRAIGILEGDLDKMLCSGLGTVFLPHSIIQFIGCDYDDVGGYIEDITPDPPKEEWLSNLKANRNLEANMVLSYKPACYFIKNSIEKALRNEEMSGFIVKEVLDDFLSVGGIKLEDVVLVLKDGHELLTNLPRTPSGLENWLQQPVEVYINKVLNESMFNKIFFKFEESGASCNL